ncbi:ATP-binding protein [Corynebacterium incognita]|uniref:ATP-binding protein n=1 Tax=Corynebacterium incognita TaxID=2754725 RepID=A0A7G7CM71_9CORY|nr:DUF4143 domain-containing protein [Corynebacterium incognita]QNE88687.1 ATP-binding protein [Corynebacterium incognita]
MSNYVARTVDQQLERYLRINGAVHVRGPRACGKTSTARQQAASEVRLDRDRELLALAQLSPSQVMMGDTPRLIDEWQVVPSLWNVIRHEVDDRQAKGQFILTGSSNPDDDAQRHPGAGRIMSLDMRTMALWERPHVDTGGVSLSQLFEDPAAAPRDVSWELSVADYVDLMVQGGWPGLQDLDPLDAQEAIDSYLTEMVEHDFPEIGGRRRDPRLFRAFLTAYSHVVAQPTQMVTIRKRMAEFLDRMPAPDSVAQLHDFAARLFMVEDQPAWSPKLRSKTALLQAPKRHLADVSLAASLLGARPGQLLADMETLGFFFESLVVHDLTVAAQAMRARGVFHYRDAKGRDEIDVVVEDRSGQWAGMEVKLSHTQVAAAESNLLRVAGKIAQPPRFLAIIIPSGRAFQLDSGVWVLPLGCLEP